MMPKLNTPVDVPSLPVRLDFNSGIVSLGSCFADEIGARLQQSGFNIDLNPFGTLYNPASIAQSIERILDGTEVSEPELVENGGLYHSFYHHGSFSHSDSSACVAACNSRLHQARKSLQGADLLMVTFGTAYIFEHDGKVVSNCHKFPADYFTRRRLTEAEIVVMWRPLLERLKAFNPKLSFLFTVSPIRHLADGAHGNQISKSTLLLAVDELLAEQSSQTACYFPAYEIVLDELRDYRFYAEDMAHPTPLATEVVWERFCEATMTPSVRQQAHTNRKLHKRQLHIPLHKN